MEITNIKTLIESKLACIENRVESLDSRNHPSLLRYELNGIRQALYIMGFELTVELNPYYHENKQPSTYTLTLR